MIRLDKYLCRTGFGSRAEVKKLVKGGTVQVNGCHVKSPEIKLDEEKDLVTVAGRQIVYEKYSYFLFHKPAGCITAVRDEKEQTVMDFLKKEQARDLAPVGRLDKDTEGLLLVTNDGHLAHNLLSPAHHVQKTYYVRTDSAIPDTTVNLFQKGVDIGDDRLTLPANLTILGPTEAELTITEGRFHQVKRMFEAVGCKVIYLKRLSMGSLDLGDLACGSYRKLLPEEIRKLRGSEKNESPAGIMAEYREICRENQTTNPKDREES